MLHLQRLPLRLSTFQVITIGFAAVILCGALLLCLPGASADGESCDFLTALFTAVSAVCVTGLVVVDTAQSWSLFGQLVLLILIQIGGLGVVTAAMALSLASGRRIGLQERSLLKDAVSAPQIGGIVRMTRFILHGVLLIEGIGAALLAPVFCRDFGLGRGIYYAVFHAISAFCNAGFDLLGGTEAFSSLTRYAADPLVNLVITALIIIGGIGFVTWDDFRRHHFHFRRWRLQSKLIVTVTGILLLVPFLLLYFLEFADLPFGERVLAAWFQTVTARTAGFNTVDLNQLSDAGKMLMILLMLIGGAPGSTAGGMKVTTIALLMLWASAGLRRQKYARAYQRRIDADSLHSAVTLFMLILSLFLGASMLLSVLEGLELLPCMFECASALGTVGLTLGLTPTLHPVSLVILMILMYSGRVGGLTLAYALRANGEAEASRLPQETVAIG